MAIRERTAGTGGLTTQLYATAGDSHHSTFGADAAGLYRVQESKGAM